MKKKIQIAMLLVGLCGLQVMAQFNYGEALQKSLLFYEAQQSGELPSWNRIDWRGDSALGDGSDVGIDLTGGWYDAGDHVKFGFPMAFTVTALAWGAIEYEDAYIQSGQLSILKRNLRFVTDYFIKCHTAPNEFYGQVGDGNLDHAFWGSPEVMQMARPSYKIDTANPGSDLASETAAALSAASIVFKNDDPAYSDLLLRHAKELYAFADEYRGEYSNSIQNAAAFYRSWSGFRDELIWGASWLYRATGEVQYLEKAEKEYDEYVKEKGTPYQFALSWDDKIYGSYVLLAQLSGKTRYNEAAERYLDFWTTGYNGERITYSPGGQAHVSQWGSLRYMSNTAFLALVYSDRIDTTPQNKEKYHDFAVSQIEYALGKNPLQRSFMIGFGNNPANNPHHRSAHGPWGNSIQNKPVQPSHSLVGALVGGPSSPDDSFVDDRTDYIANEVACDYNACFTGALARLYSEFGGNPLANPSVVTPPSRVEIGNLSKFNSTNESGSTIQVKIQNRTAWPARVTDKLSYRYFFDISETVASGGSINDYAISLNQGVGTVTINAWDANQNLYYAEVSLVGELIAPIGDPQFRRETQLNINIRNGKRYDSSNDWSAQDLNNSREIESLYIPVYDDGVLVYGSEPTGGDTPKAAFTANPTSGVAPLTVSFDASASTDPNGDVLSYNWDFGNGNIATAATPSTVYNTVGVYTVSLTVNDGTNTSTVVTETITVTDGNIAPIADFVATPPTGIAPVNVNFDASNSSDANGDALTYSWDFGDGTTGQGVNTSHSYTAVGIYQAKLTVSDGKKESSKTVQITVTNGSPVASFTISAQTGDAPLTVTLDASASVDPRGGTLSYNWDLGNGQSANTAEVTTTYNNPGTATVRLTVTNGQGESDSTEQVITITDPDAGCSFGTPLQTPLPTISRSYKNIFVFGTGGPDLSNVNDFTINWDLRNNGLYQLSLHTTNGNPDWWNNLLGKAQHNFNSVEPSVTLSGTGFPGLDGSYWVAIDTGHFVFVSKDRNFVIYCSLNDNTNICDLPLAKSASTTALTSAIRVVKNPVSNQLELATHFGMQNSMVTIMDITGSVVYKHRVTTNQRLVSLSVADLPTGLFMVEVTQQETGERFRTKIIKQ